MDTPDAAIVKQYTTILPERSLFARSALPSPHHVHHDLGQSTRESGIR